MLSSSIRNVRSHSQDPYLATSFDMKWHCCKMMFFEDVFFANLGLDSSMEKKVPVVLLGDTVQEGGQTQSNKSDPIQSRILELCSTLFTLKTWYFCVREIIGHPAEKTSQTHLYSLGSPCQVEWSDGSAVLAVQMLEVPSEVGRGQ